MVLFCISFAWFGTPPAPSRDRSVKPASGRDTWQADALGKIGSANTEKNHDESRGSFCIPKTTRWASGSKEAAADEEK